MEDNQYTIKKQTFAALRLGQHERSVIRDVWSGRNRTEILPESIQKGRIATELFQSIRKANEDGPGYIRA